MKRPESPRPIPEDDLGKHIRSVPYAPPDPGLTGRIMSALPPRRCGWLQRLYRAARTPLTVSVTPLAALTAALVVLVTGGVLLRHLSGPLGPPIRGGQQPEGVPVVFHYQDPAARAVAVMGSFNNWDPKGYEMTRDAATGHWRIEVQLAPGQHEYVFWIDDHKTAPDRSADLIREDGFGRTNSVLFIKGHHDQSI